MRYLGQDAFAKFCGILLLRRICQRTPVLQDFKFWYFIYLESYIKEHLYTLFQG